MRTKPCRVKGCCEMRVWIDNLFCPDHREEWRNATTHLCTDYTEKEKAFWIQRFCEA